MYSSHICDILLQGRGILLHDLEQFIPPGEKLEEHFQLLSKFIQILTVESKVF